jgi:glycosyltransferase involved in cell wall biosynthesis
MLCIAQSLQRRGVQVLVVGLLERTAHDLPSAPLACASVKSAFRPLAKLLRRVQPTSVVSTLKHVSVLVSAVQLGTGLRFKHICRVANTYSRELDACGRISRLLWRGVLRLSHGIAHRNICVSRGVQSDLSDRFGVRADRCVVIHNPIDLPRLHSLAAAPLEILKGHASKHAVIISIGRLTPQKDFATLIEAFALSLKQGLKAHLVIAGEGPERGVLERLAAELGVAAHVHLPGWLDNPYPLYQAADLFVLSSRFEGMPNVLLEALAFGLPVVSTDCESGPREILTQPHLGMLVPIGEPIAMAQAMGEALRKGPDPARRAYVEDRFALPVVADLYHGAILND